MARTAILSDIHANLHALCAVMEDVLAMQCTDFVCLGDVVGYNAFPRECLDYIRNAGCYVVKGNHDEEVGSPSIAKMNPIARQAMDWTRAQLDDEQLQWLSRLQYRRNVRTDTGNTFTMVHACLHKPEEWGYVLHESDAANHFFFGKQLSPLCFHGHSHMPRIFMTDGKNTVVDDEILTPLYDKGYTEFQPQAGLKYLINVGSVGQPRDMDPRSCYAIYDTELNLIILKRVSYDIATAQKAIREIKELPKEITDALSGRLEHGR